ncbi:MAG: hypothetical protein OEY99_04720, partial [Aigarchaeota archaeon]|nr:hypothetical protein [Aigarchaeota archaeon]
PKNPVFNPSLEAATRRFATAPPAYGMKPLTRLKGAPKLVGAKSTMADPRPIRSIIPQRLSV